jgi:hypothetical protein
MTDNNQIKIFQTIDGGVQQAISYSSVNRRTDGLSKHYDSNSLPLSTNMLKAGKGGGLSTYFQKRKVEITNWRSFNHIKWAFLPSSIWRQPD